MLVCKASAGINFKSGLWGFQNPVSRVYPSTALRHVFSWVYTHVTVTEKKLIPLKWCFFLVFLSRFPRVCSHCPRIQEQIPEGHTLFPGTRCALQQESVTESQTGFATRPYERPAPRVTFSLPTVVEMFKESLFMIEILFYKPLATFDTPNWWVQKDKENKTVGAEQRFSVLSIHGMLDSLGFKGNETSRLRNWEINTAIKAT